MSVNPSPENGDLSQYNYNPPAENKAAQATSMHLNFPCGIIRGARLNFRISCAVTADISNLPACDLPYIPGGYWTQDLTLLLALIRGGRGTI
uniref:Uncharacterized protein n=1 Tax=Quercus lobata TaxID=97700 RepID=A0A7N2L2L1_QUELO